MRSRARCSGAGIAAQPAGRARAGRSPGERSRGSLCDKTRRLPATSSPSQAQPLCRLREDKQRLIWWGRAICPRGRVQPGPMPRVVGAGQPWSASTTWAARASEVRGCVCAERLGRGECWSWEGGGGATRGSRSERCVSSPASPLSSVQSPPCCRGFSSGDPRDEHRRHP